MEAWHCRISETLDPRIFHGTFSRLVDVAHFESRTQKKKEALHLLLLSQIDHTMLIRAWLVFIVVIQLSTPSFAGSPNPVCLAGDRLPVQEGGGYFHQQ